MNDDDELLTYYLDWTSKALIELDDLLANLKSKIISEKINEEIYAIAHNLKGMGASFGFDLMTEAGSSLCTYLRALQSRPASASVVESHLKSMKVILTNRITGSGGDDGTALVKRLTDLAEADLS